MFCWSFLNLSEIVLQKDSVVYLFREALKAKHNEE